MLAGSSKKGSKYGDITVNDESRPKDGDSDGDSIRATGEKLDSDIVSKGTGCSSTKEFSCGKGAGLLSPLSASQ